MTGSVFITGASRGIGAHVAEHLAKQGFHLILAARSEDALKHVAERCEQYGVNSVVLPLDMTDFNAVNEKLTELLPRVDLQSVFINHGIAHFGSFLEDDQGRWLDTINVNLSGAMNVAQTVIPYLKAASSPSRSLIFTASMVAKVYAPHAAAYCASKHGLLAFANSLFELVREDGIKVSSLCPGFVNTSLVDFDELNADKMIQPAEIARAVDFIHSSPVESCPVEMLIKPQYSPYRS